MRFGGLARPAAEDFAGRGAGQYRACVKEGAAQRALSILAKNDDPTSPLRKGYPQDALFAGNKVVPSDKPERGISHVAVMPRRFSTCEKLTLLNRRNHQTSLFRMHLPRKDYQQVRFSDSGGVRRTPETGDALFAGNKVELRGVNKVGGARTRRELFCSGRLQAGPLPRKGYLLRRNVYQQDELSPQHRVALFAGSKG